MDATPPRAGISISVAVPASIVADVPHLRERTAKIGLLARAAAIFRAEEIIIYLDSKDPDCQNAQNLVRKVLDYISTPQYLRRIFFHRDPELKYVGVLPPLRTPDHPLAARMADLREGERREGAVLSSRGGESTVEIGVERPLRVRGTLRAGTRVTACIIDPLNGRGEVVGRENVDAYWGFRTAAPRSSLGDLLREGRHDATIATSRYGRPIDELWKGLSSLLARSRSMLLIFGSPSEGVSSILARENVNLEASVDAVVNTVPNQGTATIRTEEAVIASLAVFNSMIEGMKLGP
jgi:predicted SPOUT superfamily RNA methylase MTH1